MHLFDLNSNLRAMMNPTSISLSEAATQPSKQTNQPIFTFKGHKSEGFAIDWSPAVQAGRLASGDCAGKIHVWNAAVAGAAAWTVDGQPFVGHAASVEDIQWSPAEPTVFASASADRTVKIWDTRGRNGPQISWDAHAQDVNVISWNRSVGYLLASGSDDGSFKVWDLRTLGAAKGTKTSPDPLAYFTYHKGPITSIEW